MQKIIYISIALISLITFLFILHYYIFSRFERIFKINKTVLIAILASLTISFILMEIIERYASNQIINTFYFISSVWLGVFFLLIIGFVIVDFAYTLIKILGMQANYKTLGIAMLLLIPIITIYSIINAANIKINKINLKFNNLAKNIKIVQISDIHLGNIHSKAYLEKAVKMTNQLNPDLVLITGDLFDESDNISKIEIEPIKNLKSTYGTYFVIGNHEKYFGIERAIDLIKKQNVIVLRNEIKNIGGIQLIGIDYPSYEFSKKNEALTKLEVNKNNFSILMYHPPLCLKESIEKGINLQLSGHTHNGQIFPFSLLEKLIFKYTSGLHKMKENSYIYVSQGTGTWGPPMRFLTINEITEINLFKD